MTEAERNFAVFRRRAVRAEAAYRRYGECLRALEEQVLRLPDFEFERPAALVRAIIAQTGYALTALNDLRETRDHKIREKMYP